MKKLTLVLVMVIVSLSVFSQSVKVDDLSILFSKESFIADNEMLDSEDCPTSLFFRSNEKTLILIIGEDIISFVLRDISKASATNEHDAAIVAAVYFEEEHIAAGVVGSVVFFAEGVVLTLPGSETQFIMTGTTYSYEGSELAAN